MCGIENLLYLMQNLPLPHIPVQRIFIFTIFGINNLKIMSHFYNEVLVKKGPYKMCSLLLDYITNHKYEIVKELNFYPDSFSWPKQKSSCYQTHQHYLLMGDSTKYFIISLSEDTFFCPVTGTLDLSTKTLHKTDTMCTTDEYCKLNVQ
jgi:hypothetical protein